MPVLKISQIEFEMQLILEVTFRLDEIDPIAQQILEKLRHKVVIFEAEMGSGKTTLIKSLLKTMGTTEVVSSPTFSLVNEYETRDKTAYHFDLYRIKSTAEAIDAGFLHYLEEDARLFIEWPDKIMQLLPAHYHLIHLEVLDDLTRKLSLWTV